jgi:hypothetical protein
VPASPTGTNEPADHHRHALIEALKARINASSLGDVARDCGITSDDVRDVIAGKPVADRVRDAVTRTIATPKPAKDLVARANRAIDLGDRLHKAALDVWGDLPVPSEGHTHLLGSADVCCRIARDESCEDRRQHLADAAAAWAQMRRSA